MCWGCCDGSPPTRPITAGLDNALLVRTSSAAAIQAALVSALQSIACVDPATGDAPTILVLVARVLDDVARGDHHRRHAVLAGHAGHAHGAGVDRGVPPALGDALGRAGCFLSTTLVGLCVLFMAGVFLSLPPSAATCSALGWTANLGFMLTFAPLLAKTYRVYRIYAGDKLTVTKISNRRVAALIGGMLAVEVLLLSVWQAVSPLQPLLITRMVGYPAAPHDYVQCSVSGQGLALSLVLAGEKAALLLSRRGDGVHHAQGERGDSVRAAASPGPSTTSWSAWPC